MLEQELATGEDWQDLPTLFPSQEHLSKLPKTLYHHTQDWVRDCQLDDFNYVEVTWEGTAPQSQNFLSRQPVPIVEASSSSKSSTECGGVNCNKCMTQLMSYFQPIQIGNNAYKCSLEQAPPITTPLPFVVTIPQGRTWIAPQTNSWMICKAIAVKYLSKINCIFF